MIPPSWLWIPLTVFAAAAQTVRNTAQRHLTAELGALGATLVRFLYGIPVLAAWLCFVLLLGESPHPALGWTFGGWVGVAAISQMAGTALLLRAMEERSFAIGLVYSKSEVIQVAIFAVLFLGEPLPALAIAAIGVATLGVILLTPRPAALDGLKRTWADPAAFYGLASGSAFAISVVGYRGANLALDTPSPFLAAAETLFWSQLLQAVLLSVWLLARNPAIVLGALRQWRVSVFAGVAGATASLANVTALALAPASQVRTLILIEVVFSYFVSRRVFREAMNRRELAGIVLIMAGVVLILWTTRD
jgi:drug/metabolite transporter (DMT)-like permease